MSKGERSRIRKLAAALRHAFTLKGPHGALTDADRELLRRLALGIVVRRMGMPAVLFLQSVRPLSYVGSQALTFLRPFLADFVKRADYERLTTILERREGVGALLSAVEAALAEKQGAGQ